MKSDLNLNCIPNRRIRNTCVTWQGIDYKLPEDDTIVSKHVGGGVIICELIIRLLVIIQYNIK